ncbi:TPA: BRCT domain-containing protein [Haemophilus influenzae]
MLVGCLSLFVLIVITGVIATYLGELPAGIFFWGVIALGFFAVRAEKKKQKQAQEEKLPQDNNDSVLSVAEYATPQSKRKNKNIIEFTYTNADGDTKHREVRVDYTDDVYIEGYCYVAGDNRTFRLDRIDGLIEQNGEFYTVDEWLEQRGIRKNQYQSKLSSKSTSSQLEICFTGFSKVDREYLESLAEIHDFKVRKTVTKNLNFLIMGDNAGPTKINSAIDVGATLLDENEFKTMIETGEIPQ